MLKKITRKTNFQYVAFGEKGIFLFVLFLASISVNDNWNLFKSIKKSKQKLGKG